MVNIVVIAPKIASNVIIMRQEEAIDLIQKPKNQQGQK
jgi:hypothetical protein